MSCRICGRNSCTESFHSIEQQNALEDEIWKLQFRTKRELALELVALRKRLNELEGDDEQ